MNKPMKIRGLFFVLALSLLSMAAGCSGEKEPTAISAEPDMVTLDWNQALVPVALTTNSEWEASSSKEWCRLSISKGRESQPVNIIVDEYDGDDTRSAVVTFKTTGEKEVITTVFVSQSGENKWK